MQPIFSPPLHGRAPSRALGVFDGSRPGGRMLYPPLLHPMNWSGKDVMIQSWGGQGTVKLSPANYVA
jgi:hypothetical protein